MLKTPLFWATVKFKRKKKDGSNSSRYRCKDTVRLSDGRLRGNSSQDLTMLSYMLLSEALLWHVHTSLLHSLDLWAELESKQWKQCSEVEAARDGNRRIYNQKPSSLVGGREQVFFFSLNPEDQINAGWKEILEESRRKYEGFRWCIQICREHLEDLRGNRNEKPVCTWQVDSFPRSP